MADYTDNLTVSVGDPTKAEEDYNALAANADFLKEAIANLGTGAVGRGQLICTFALPTAAKHLQYFPDQPDL